MKLTDYIIIFIIITLPFILLTSIQRQVMANTIDRKIEINRYIETAVEDATSDLISQNSGNKIMLNKDRALKNFYNTLYVNFGVVDSPILKAKIMGYIPVILITESDGFTVVSKDEYIDNNGSKILTDLIHMKVYYSYSDDKYTYLFSNNDNLTVIDRDTNNVYKGSREELSGELNTTKLNDKDTYEKIRRDTINNTIRSQINYYIDKHNSIKDRLGIHYEFYLVEDEYYNWSQQVDGIKFIAIFQGMPLNNLGQHYSEISIGEVRLERTKKYYIEENSVNGFLYYHREDCSELINKNQPIESCQEAAKSGAFPCEVCKP